MSLLDNAYDVHDGWFNIPSEHIYKKKKEIPMEFEGMSSLQVLEEIKKELHTIRDHYKTIKNKIDNEIQGMDMVLININEFLDYNNENNVSKIDPSKCLHINKKISDNGHAETVLCADCGLMLSYKVL